MVKKIIRPATGAQCAAEAMRQINPDVVAAYPITPQTPVMHAFAKFVADGSVDTEFITVESEHSAMSSTVGSASAGVRAMTATSANGLALMFEIVYIAASMRLPIVMNIVNRALSGPINIHCDHSDSMACRDSGWMQLYSETGQDAYENNLIAIKTAENPKVLLPIMVCQDGFITSHSVERAEFLDDATVKKFIGEYKPHSELLDTKNPITAGPFDMYDYYFEHKRQQADGMEQAKKVLAESFKAVGELTGKKYDFVEPYNDKNAKVAILALGSTVGTAKGAVDDCKINKNVAVINLRVFRPFPAEQIIKKLKKFKAIAILDRVVSLGAKGSVLYNEIRSAFNDETEKPKLINYIYGLGGRDTTPNQIKKVVKDLIAVTEGKKIPDVNYLGVRE